MFDLGLPGDKKRALVPTTSVLEYLCVKLFEGGRPSFGAERPTWAAWSFIGFGQKFKDLHRLDAVVASADVRNVSTSWEPEMLSVIRVACTAVRAAIGQTCGIYEKCHSISR